MNYSINTDTKTGADWLTDGRGIFT